MALSEQNFNSPFKPDKNFRSKKNYSGNSSADNYQKFLEFLDMSGNSQAVRRKVIQNAVFLNKDKKIK